ncbi:phage antirepressor KilAC domain-containing protein [Acinetobacter sp. ANC 5383]
MNMPISIPQAAIGSINHIEIAQLVQTEPRNVKLSIERLASKSVIQLPPMAKVENKQSLSPNRFSDAYVFSGEQGKLDSVTVVAQLCPQFTALLVKRWYELENQVAKPVALSRMDLIQLALAAEQENHELKEQVAVLEPKAQALDAIADTVSTFTIRDTAKTIGVPEKTLVQFLLDKHWVYRENSKHRRLCAYSTAIEKGLMINKVTSVISYEEGDHVYTQARVTAKGLTRLTAMIEKAGLKQ